MVMTDVLLSVTPKPIFKDTRVLTVRYAGLSDRMQTYVILL
jgi:hypothetical protein